MRPFLLKSPELKSHTIRFLLRNSVTTSDDENGEVFVAYGEQNGLTVTKGIIFSSEKILPIMK